MIKRIEIVYRDRFAPRLTVAPDRVTMKFPNKYPEKYSSRKFVEKMFFKVADKLKSETLSYRGVFYMPEEVLEEPIGYRRILLTMYTNGRRFHKTFEIDELKEKVTGPLTTDIVAKGQPKE